MKKVQLWRYDEITKKGVLVDEKETDENTYKAYRFPFMSNYYLKILSKGN